MKTSAFLLGALLCAVLIFAQIFRANNPVIVHEWGTFTCLQDKEGEAIGGINVDDEPVPDFVWQVAGTSVVSQGGSNVPGQKSAFGLPPHGGGKGWIAGDPAVTMRLETPVLYIYPPKGRKPESVPPLDVHVDFHGGVLSQYYPYATATGLPLNGTIPYFQQKLTKETTSGLTWTGVQIGASGQLVDLHDPSMKDAPPWFRGQPVETADKVWTTPREVSAPLLEVKMALTDGGVTHRAVQAEHFLFYRGVGHLLSPYFVEPVGALEKGEMVVGEPVMESAGGKLDFAWMVQIEADGRCAYHFMNHPKLEPYMVAMTMWYPSVSVAFAGADFSAGNLTQLKASMRTALIQEGLYPDEASAMLRTWELSYFKSPGLRFFYIVPKPWVEKVLPLQITGAPTKITRVMVGRIELITESQRQALGRLVLGPCPDLPAFKKQINAALEGGKWSKEDVAAFQEGSKPLSDLGLKIPPLIEDYLGLGRFRDALVMQAYLRNPSQAIVQFIQDNGIAPRGMEIKAPYLLLGSPNLNLKNPGRPADAGLHF